ncbi:hypothetical protein E0Z10_g6575 [Xylaria hypoxylon]|uniref:Carrier domain-containing protein n=1 Tax=Xylaria hypoxylon TaxID=37992 RepID=A0A4Z0YXS8_9PEZI|nr:hypothetical protein E0Z10_g6575 [Xylaria hypoxylon]
MTLCEWQQVLEPKVEGTWNLHKVLPKAMDFFVILSSAGGMMGSSGQSQYNAASTFQDAFARYRWSQGEKCISLDVGMVSGVGYAAENIHIMERLGRKGLEVLREQELHSVLDWACDPSRALSSPWSTQVITAIGGLSKSQDSLHHLKRPMYRHLLRKTRGMSHTTRSAKEKVDFSALIHDAKDADKARGIIASALANRLSQALSIPLEDLELTRPVYSYGVDSLVAVELRFWLANEMGADVSVFDILSAQSIDSLSGLVATRSRHLIPPS